MQKIIITQEELDLGEGQFDQYMQYVLHRMSNASYMPELAVFNAVDLVQKDGYSVIFGSDMSASGTSISNWMRNNFGERQNVSWCFPQIAYPIFGCIYFLRMPLIRPESLLLTQAVADLTPDMEKRLSARQFLQIEKDYNEFYEALEMIARFDSTTLVHLKSAAQLIYEGPAHFALSRWESLHFIELAMKEVLEPLDVKETGKKGHDVAGVLHSHWLNKGKNPLPQSALDAVNCSADMRYQKSPTSFVRALNAHHESIRLAALIAHEIPPASPMEDSMSISIKGFEKGVYHLIARILPALKGDNSSNRKINIIRSDDSEI